MFEQPGGESTVMDNSRGTWPRALRRSLPHFALFLTVPWDGLAGLALPMCSFYHASSSHSGDVESPLPERLPFVALNRATCHNFLFLSCLLSFLPHSVAISSLTYKSFLVYLSSVSVTPYLQCRYNAHCRFSLPIFFLPATKTKRRKNSNKAANRQIGLGL